MNDFPNLAGVATAELVEHIGTGKFSAAYINWSRTLHLLRTHAPGWLPETVPAPDGYLLHQAPVGAYLLIRFRRGDTVTPAVPQAVMDTRNAAIPIDKITARDITDTHRRGVCMAAAMLFGLAYELWAKMPLESGHSEGQDAASLPHQPPASQPVDPDTMKRLHASITQAADDDALVAARDKALEVAAQYKDEDAYRALRASARKRAWELKHEHSPTAS